MPWFISPAILIIGSNSLAVFRRFLFVLTCLVVGQSAAIAAGPSLLFDPATGAVISQDRAGEPWYPASLTKLMTAYLVFQKLRAGAITLDQKIPVSALASSQPPSKIGIKSGGTISVDLALQALLVYSANDMAYVLAEAAGGSLEAFVKDMNRTAGALGMSGSHFVNPNGLYDPRHVSTARDIALLASALLQDFPEYSHYFSQPYLEIGKRKLANRNALLRQMPEADGMKTGFVCNSGYNLVATATHEGRKLGAVILGANNGKHRADLAEMLLVDGFSRPESVHTTLAQLQNMKTGTVVPADMTTTACKQKPPVTITNAKSTDGWGISFGNYESPVHADMALRGRLLSDAGRDLAGTPGVVRMPGKSGYAAMLWNLSQQDSLATCSHYREERAPCDVLTPETLEQIAEMAPEPPPKPANATAQGSDSSNTKKKAKRSAKKKKKKKN
ncbi:MAG: D-alanyl-D-alanine carboxypeptidase [Alphaproteobacteria bacterium]|nr:D-alanyl-D-alanine carboxypeptidase [Alphaproteobacteria bacterium]